MLPTSPDPSDGTVIVFPLPSLLLDEVLAVGVYQIKFVSGKFYKKLPLFRRQPSNDIMWAHLPSSSGLSGWREVVAVKLSPAYFPVHLRGPAQWLSFKITPVLLQGECSEVPQQAGASPLANFLTV